MVFCADAPLAARVHELLASQLPATRPLLLTEGTAAAERADTQATSSSASKRVGLRLHHYR